MPNKVNEETREFARALLAAGKTYREVAEALEISVGTVHNIAKEPRGEIEPLVEELKGRFAMKYWLLADHIMNKITPGNILKASLKEKAIAAAIFTDKAVELEKQGRRPAPDSAGEVPETAKAAASDMNALEQPIEDISPCFESINRPRRGF